MEMHNTDPFAASFDYASGKTGERFQNPLWSITEILFGKKFRQSVARVRAFGSVIVANAIQSGNTEVATSATTSLEGDEAVDETAGSLINSLLAAIDDHQLVADAALNYLSAGKCTEIVNSCSTINLS